MLSRNLVVGDFWETARKAILGSEGFSSIVYNDSQGIPTVGYGQALIVEVEKGVWRRLTDTELNNLFAGVHNWTADEKQDLDKAARLKSGISGSNPFPDSPNGVNYYNWLINSEQAEQIFTNDSIARKAALSKRLGNYTGTTTNIWSDLEGSYEGVALYSLAYNSPKLIGKNLVNALQQGNRAAAWFEIRITRTTKRKIT